jgi:hypothetical protein
MRLMVVLATPVSLLTSLRVSPDSTAVRIRSSRLATTAAHSQASIVLTDPASGPDGPYYQQVTINDDGVLPMATDVFTDTP